MKTNSQIYFTLISIILFASILSCRGKEELTVPGIIKAELALKIKAQLGEGAFWNHENQIFYWVDIEGKKLHLFNPAQGSNRSFDMPSRIGTVVPADSSHAVVALENGVYTVNTNSGELNQLSDIESDMPYNRFNDGKCDPAGRFWVGSMHYEQTEPKANLYMIDGKGNTTKMLDNITISNGIVWSSDHKTMYYIDTPTETIMAYDFDIASGQISNGRIAVKVEKSLGFPDGMAIDERDRLWVGMWNGGIVAQFDPDNGKLITTVKVPAHNVTACAFGGPNLDTLYITTSSLDMTIEELKKHPDAGSIFKAVPGVNGVESALFKR